MPHSAIEPSAVELILEIARALVDRPEEVAVDSADHDAGTVLRLRVDPTDVGKVIGKQGRTARSLRTILGAVSVKLHHRYTLEIIEEVKSGSMGTPEDH
ncbi:MAG TPA: KH domain-containing protein [Acidobacteriaceae bacterium]|nr:KH domain-containing protein [Acidobacteriaceae bacterium]